MRNRVVYLTVMIMAIMSFSACNKAVNQSLAGSESFIASSEGTPTESSSEGITEPGKTDQAVTTSSDLKNTEQTSSQPISSAALATSTQNDIEVTSAPATSAATKTNADVTATTKPTATTKQEVKTVTMKPTVTAKPTVTPTVKPTPTPIPTPIYEIKGQAYISEVLRGVNEARQIYSVSNAELDEELSYYALIQAKKMAEAGEIFHSEEPKGCEGCCKVPYKEPGDAIGYVISLQHVPQFVEQEITKVGIAVVRNGKYLYAVLIGS